MSVLFKVLDLRDKYADTWRTQPESYWLTRLMQEVDELASAQIGNHEHTVDHELEQIAAICLNWLDMRQKRMDKEDAGGGG